MGPVGTDPSFIGTLRNYPVLMTAISQKGPELHVISRYSAKTESRFITISGEYNNDQLTLNN